MKKQRQPELHFYEWSISRWLGSGTRMVLPDYGRGIYRELLDLCYSQGSIPNINVDADAKAAIAAHCGSTPERFDETWSKVSAKFIVSKKDAAKLVSPAAEIIRREYFTYVEEQRARAKQNRGRTTRLKSTDKEAMASEVQSDGSKHSEPIQTNGKLTAIQTNGNTTQTPTATEPLSTPVERFDYELRFGEVWNLYPTKGRTKIHDAQRIYIERVSARPEETHARIVETLSPGGDWAESEQFAKGFVPGLPEWIRNSRWLEHPARRGESLGAMSNPNSGGRSAQAMAQLEGMK